MADLLTEEEPLTQAPPTWKAVEASEKYKNSSNVERRTAFSKWDDYSRTYAQQQGLWDDPQFQEAYQSKAGEVVKGLRTYTDIYQESAINSYNVVRNTGRAAKREWMAGGVALELQKPNPDLKWIADTQKTINEYAPSAEFNTTWDDSVAPRDSWEAFKKDPVGNVAQLLAGSFGAQIRATGPSLHKIPEKMAQFGAAGVLAGAVAGPGAPITGTAMGVAGLAGGLKQGLSEAQMAGSYAVEYGGDMIDSLRKAGVDVTNYDQMKAAFADPAKIKEIKEHAQKKAVPVAVGDGILGVIAGSMFPGSPLVKGPVKQMMSKIGQWAGEMLFQGAGSATAEAVSQVASEGKIYSPKSVIAEFGADVVADVVGVGVGRAANALVNAKPEQQAKFAEVAPLAKALKENNAPLTAQAVVKNTLKEVATEDPDLVSELMEQEAPEGTFAEEPDADARFAPPPIPPEARTEEEALAAVPPTLEPELSAPPPVDEIAPEQPVAEILPNEPTSITVPAEPAAGAAGPVLPEAQPQPAAQVVPQDVAPELGEVGAVTPGAVVAFNGQPAVVADVRGDGTVILRQTSEQGREVFVPARVDQITLNEQPIQERVPEPQGAISPAGTIPTAVTDGIADRGLQPVAAPAAGPTGTVRPSVAAGPIQNTVPAVKPSSQSTASFTPEQNAVHDAFVAQEPPPLEKPEEAQHFSSWAQENAPKRPIILYNDKGHTAVITPSSKPDRKLQVTFMDTGNEGIPEAFHDIAAQSVDEGVAEAYRRGFTDTQKYKNYDRAGKTSTAGKGIASPDTQSRVGQRPGELPGAPEGIRAEVPAPTNEEQLQRASSIRVDAPAGATFIRATDAQGRVSEESLKGANRGLNVFQGAGPWAKVEAGTRDRKGNFVPMEGSVTIQDRAQAELEKKVNGFPKNQQAKAHKAVTADDSPDPYKGAPLNDIPPVKPGKNGRLISELARVGALDDNASGRSVLEFLANDSKTPAWARTLAKALTPFAGDISIEASYRPQSTWAALYAGRGSRILINTAARNPGVGITILHEVAHHVTLSKIEGKAKLNETEQAAAQNLQDLFEKAKKAYKGDRAYGFKDLGEFVSEAFSNAGFRAKLDNLTLEGDRVPFLQRLSNAIARLVFGRPVATGSLLESAIQNAMDLAGEPVIESPQATYQFSNAEVTAPMVQAFHGTPHKVDKFSAEKVGTGEGAQVYGYGLYFAEEPQVAEQYAKQVKDIAKLDHANKRMSELARTMHQDEILGQYRKYRTPEGEAAAREYDALMESKMAPGNTYSVELDVEPEDLLDWDKPLSQQSEKVQGVLREIGVMDKPPTKDWGTIGSTMESGAEIYRQVKSHVFFNSDTPIAGNAEQHAQKEASNLLNKLGIAGIRYLDQGSRRQTWTVDLGGGMSAQFGDRNAAQKAADGAKSQGGGTITESPGTYNYVIFDDSKIKIREENGKAVGDINSEVVAPMQQKESAVSQAGSWASSLFHPNASQEAQAKAAGELLQVAEVPTPPTEQEIKPLTPEQAKLVEDNLGVSGFWAKKFYNILGTTQPERDSEARMALIKAAQNYDPSKGEFKQYASWAVKNKLIGLYKSKAKQASREVSANSVYTSGDYEGTELQDTLEATPETPPIDTAAIDILNKAKSTLAPRDQKIMDDFASGLTLRQVGEIHRLSYEGVRKIIKTAGQKIISALNDAGITDIESIFPKQEERTQVLRTKPSSPEDEAADTSGAVGQLEAKDIERSEPLLTEDEDVVAPLSPEGKETKIPWREVKEGAYRPLGKAFSAGGRWSRELFDALKTKNQKIRAAYTHVEFADNEVKSYLKKNFIKKKISVPLEAINTAFGSAENKLTKDQVDEAKRIRVPLQEPASLVAAKKAYAANPTKDTEKELAKEMSAFEKAKDSALKQAKAAFLQTARLENLDAFKRRQKAALLSLPKDLQVLVTSRRDAVDALSRDLRNRGDITDSLKFTIDENLETYQHRSYAIFDGDEHVKWVMSDDPDAKRIRNRVEALFTQDARARAAVQYAKDQKSANTPVTKAQAKAHVSGLDVTSEVRKMIHDYKSVADGSVMDIMRGKVPGQSSRNILKVRGDIPEAVRDFWGEHKDPSVNYAKTYAAVAGYLADLDFKTNVLSDGLQKGYLWKEGVSTDPFPENVVKLFGEGSKSMGPLDGVYGPAILRDAFAELDQQYTKDWLTTMTSFALQAKTKYSNVATVRNFIGNGSIMGLTGNLFWGDYRKAALATVANFRKLGSKEIQEYVVDGVKHGVFGDNVGPGILREMAARAAGVHDLPIGALVKKAGSWVDDKASGIYGGADDFWKVVSWEAEKAKLRWAVPTLSEAENKSRAAAITRRTVPTYSEALKFTQDLFNKNILGKFIAPFTTFITEIVRVTGGNIMQAKEEIMSGNPRLQYIGSKRIAWMLATYFGWKAAVAASKYWNDYDDEDDAALRRQLADWQKDAMLFYLPKKKNGDPRFLDISYLNPYNYIFDPIDTIVNAVMHGKGAVETGAKVTVSVVKQIFKPFISNQLFIGAIGDVMHNQKPSGAPIYNEMDPWNVQAMKAAGYVGAALEPGLLTSAKGFFKAAIGYKERSGKEYDMMSQIISLAGQRVTAHDPKQSFQFQVGEFKRQRQSASYMFSYIANSQGTVGAGDVARAYLAANKANKEVAQNLRSNYLAAQTLGVSKDSAQQTLKSEKAGWDAMNEADSGVYTRYTPGDELLKEIKNKFPDRYNEFLRAYGSTPAQEALE